MPRRRPIVGTLTAAGRTSEDEVDHTDARRQGDRTGGRSPSCGAPADPKLRDRLVEQHLWLARHCARRFSGRGESADDLTQVANLALVKAVDRFDPTFQVRFTTFAVPTIVGELRRHFRDRTWSMRVSRRLKDLHLELKAASEQLAHDLGRSPTVDELADALDCTPEDVLEALEAGAAYRATSLSAGLGTEEGEEIIPGEADEDLDDTEPPRRAAARRSARCPSASDGSSTSASTWA